MFKLLNAAYARYDRVLISLITWIEVMVGAREDEEGIRDFLSSRFEVVSLDGPVAETAIVVRRTRHLRLPDAIILATAQVYDAELVTRNTKDFDPSWDGVRVPYII